MLHFLFYEKKNILILIDAINIYNNNPIGFQHLKRIAFSILFVSVSLLQNKLNNIPLALLKICTPIYYYLFTVKFRFYSVSTEDNERIFYSRIQFDKWTSNIAAYFFLFFSKNTSGICLNWFRCQVKKVKRNEKKLIIWSSAMCVRVCGRMNCWSCFPYTVRLEDSVVAP